MIKSKEFKKLELLMKFYEKPWFVAGGWTIDLLINEITRDHKDMDICIFREDAEYALQYFHDWDINVAIPGEHRLEKVTQMTDIELPRYCLHLFKEQEFIELLLTSRIEDQVIFRKNNQIKMSMDDFCNKSGEIPFVNPAWQLLFKSLSTREEDEHDFLVYMNRVSDNKSKSWLLQSMKVMNGNKRWIEELSKQLNEGGDI
ncbi:hypothetical protein E0485_05655 [Paenibacillus albiflavus]|uniref:Nucleotidyltransferase family protein n=1 Tax=Paenibacillus albiflavus TaxID=2545760 RepID=A0A4R4ELV9_9BACL|nr:hypothetical protein [Paenibacillus albiflavus]TCZ79345.1 hypothetical protein E0485_05655 [Paenibacillus albiflavus]